MSKNEPRRSVAIAGPTIRIAPLGELLIWPITDEELKQFEQGSPAGLFLNFSLALLSSGFSFLATLLATPIKSNRVFIVFVVVCSTSLIAGVVLLALWWRSQGQLTKLAERIRQRMPPTPGVSESND